MGERHEWTVNDAKKTRIDLAEMNRDHVWQAHKAQVIASFYDIYVKVFRGCALAAFVTSRSTGTARELCHFR